MKAIITPGSLSGSVEAISSKSQAHRYLICAALSRNPSRVVCPSLSKDIEAIIIPNDENVSASDETVSK
jgi:3-phosphoshikimate 1-carboxyvinyltransferase